MLLSETERAYVAGLIDADGCLSIVPSMNTYRASINITNNNLKLLEWVQDRCGGTIYHTRTWHRLTWNGRAVLLELLDQIEPYLVGKEEQAYHLRAFLHVMGTRGKRITDDLNTERKELMECLRNYDKGGRHPSE